MLSIAQKQVKILLFTCFQRSIPGNAGGSQSSLRREQPECRKTSLHLSKEAVGKRGDGCWYALDDYQKPYLHFLFQYYDTPFSGSHLWLSGKRTLAEAFFPISTSRNWELASTASHWLLQARL